LYSESIERNSIHGSDSLESAERELNLFFDENEWK
jgi:nucleoside diphosphate kinase